MIKNTSVKLPPSFELEAMVTDTLLDEGIHFIVLVSQRASGISFSVSVGLYF